jgi:DNA-binding NtrC family response regulator
MQKPMVVLVAVEEALRHAVQGLLRRQGYTVLALPEAADFFRDAYHCKPALVVVGSAIESPWHTIEVAQRLYTWEHTVPVLLLMSHRSEDLLLAALRAGVRDYVTAPVSLDDLELSIRRCLANSSPSCQTSPVALAGDKPWMIGESPALQRIKTYIGKVATVDSSVLITGETGTGKELVAVMLHRHSPRRRRPLVSINCAAIPDSLLESELFGYERGAFTGAHAAKPGTLQRAEGGTVFFDEIGEMSPYAQAKLLRVLDNKEVQRLGGTRQMPLNIRVIAATNQDLEHLTATGMFRKDLYYRLNVARIHLPPLRDRQADLPLLLAHYIQEANHHLGRQVERFTDEALAALQHYDWPGNVRELKNLVEAAFINLPTPQSTLLELPEAFRPRQEAAVAVPPDECDQLLSALSATHWNKSQAAKQLHWSRMTLYRKMAKYHIVSGGKRPDNGQ